MNAVFVFYTLYISLTQYALNGDAKMNPFTPKTDHNLNSPHGFNTPTNMESITIRENPNWRIIFS